MKVNLRKFRLIGEILMVVIKKTVPKQVVSTKQMPARLKSPRLVVVKPFLVGKTASIGVQTKTPT